MMETLQLKEEAGAILLPIKVRPRGRANSLDEVRDGVLLMTVTAAPTDGEANSAVISTLAKSLRLAKSDVEIRRGEKSRTKTVLLHGINLADLCTRLNAVLMP
jgi:uncharacterized protein (TIGR00251 family)